MQGAHRVRLTEPERHELPAVVLAAIVVGLVGDEDHVVATPSQPVGDRLVVVGDANGRVDDEQHDVGPADGGLDLARHLGVQRRCRAAGHPASGVDDAEGDAEPLRFDLLAIAGDAGAVLDDRGLLADDAVEQRRLADVGASDDGDDGKAVSGHARSVPRARRAARGRRWR